MIWYIEEDGIEHFTSFVIYSNRSRNGDEISNSIHIVCLNSRRRADVLKFLFNFFFNRFFSGETGL